jgi:hypothetical protein
LQFFDADGNSNIRLNKQRSSTAEPTDSSTNNRLCQNEFMPVISDLQRIYRVKKIVAGSTSNSTNYETIFYFDGENYFTVSTRLKRRIGYPVDEVWDCSRYGLTRTAFESGEFSTFFMDNQKEMSTRQTGDWCPGGVTLPVSIHVNDSWTQQTDFQFTSSDLNGWNWFKWKILHQPLNAKRLPLPAGSGRFTYRYKAIGFERIIVPAGTYNALRIDVTAEGYIDPSRDFSPTFENSGCVWNSNAVDQVSPMMSLTFKGSIWWASDVGLVKKVGTIKKSLEEIESYKMELDSFEVP